MGKLDNKVVFITGGNSGIGQACAFAAAREGANVVVADLPTVDHTATMNELDNSGGDHVFAPIDVADVESVKAAIQATVKKYGRLDVALNNAGIGASYSGTHELDEKEWDQMIQTDLTGQFYCVKYQLQQFLAQGGGVIVNMASIAGLKVEIGLPAYTVAKHGVLGLTKIVTAQYGDKNIRANSICPYYTDTPLLRHVPDVVLRSMEERTPARRLANASEMAKAFIYLASDDSSFCNGIELIVDGGFMVC